MQVEQITTGIENTFIGGRAGDALTVGEKNVAVGYAALTSADVGNKQCSCWSKSIKTKWNGGGSAFFNGVGANTGRENYNRYSKYLLLAVYNGMTKMVYNICRLWAAC